MNSIKKNIIRAIFFFILLLTISLKDVNAQNRLLDSVISTIKNKSVYKNRINWDKTIPLLNSFIDKDIKDSVLAILPSIQKLYTLLGDKHGYVQYKGQTYHGNFVTTKNTKSLNYLKEKYTDENIAFRTKLLKNNIGYISIPAMQIDASDPNIFKDTSLLFQSISNRAKIIQDSLLALLSNHLEGLIVDLRLIPGGTMFIILEGLAPILGDGIFMYNRNSKGNYTTYKKKNNNLYEDSIRMAYTSNPSTKIPKLKIVILISSITASAGEQTAISFKGKKDVVFIGDSTAGFTTMNGVKNNWYKDFIFTYVDATTLDRHKNTYDDKVIPDILVRGGDNFEDLNRDKKIIAALQWLKK
ncbi:MAG: hypothetical protein DI598_13520 [Pseudopedobacter saltans]|uniref:Tail specific protease domain-containing protein n=1 Tax=Pseudopedobacter saltans TaxID=151895 RepID=A0A2W5GTL4_9SPHI|nr:MAG: hypothetical protein DI598_13520 [Pseudopedobacter saltans]